MSHPIRTGHGPYRAHVRYVRSLGSDISDICPVCPVCPVDPCHLSRSVFLALRRFSVGVANLSYLLTITLGQLRSDRTNVRPVRNVRSLPPLPTSKFQTGIIPAHSLQFHTKG